MIPGIRLLDWLTKALNGLVVASVIGLVATMTLQVILRYFLNASFIGVEEISTLFGLWLYFCGLALVSARGQHIVGGFIAPLLSDRANQMMAQAFALMASAMCAYFFYLSMKYSWFIVSVGRKSTFLRLPTLLWVASFNVGFLLSTVAFALRAFHPVARSDP